MQNVSFDQITDRMRTIDFPQVDLVVGIGRGGTVPAALTAFMLNCPLRIVPVNYRDESNKPCRKEPELFSAIDLPQDAGSILIVDDVAVTGQTLEAVKARIQKAQTTTFVFKGTADIVLFPEFENCVQWPWNIVRDVAGNVPKVPGK